MSSPSSEGTPQTASPCADGYGCHPRAHPVVESFANEVVQILENTPEPDDIPRRVAEAMAPMLETEDLLCDELREPDTSWYRKHVLYADPEKRFTVLALIWLPGQGTVVHGHTAWGAVGVYEGNPNVACYDCEELEGGKHSATQTKDIHCQPGDTATVRPGICDVHRIYNATESTMITVHTYGCDLVDDPDAININLSL